jgi:hypothetical protein
MNFLISLKMELTDKSEYSKLLEMDKKRGAMLFCTPRIKAMDKQRKVGSQIKMYSKQLNRKNEAI